MCPAKRKQVDSIEKILIKTLPEIHSIGTTIFDPVWAINTHSDPRNELIYILEGEEQLVSGSRRWKAGPGDVIMVPAETRHRDEFDVEKDFKTFLLSSL